MDVRVTLAPDPAADDEDRERLSRQLRRNLRSLDDVELSSIDAPTPHRAKSGAGVALSEWLLTLSASGGVLVTVVATVRDWLNRRDGAHKVAITIDGDTLELDGATPSERAKLVESFIQRHQSA